MEAIKKIALAKLRTVYGKHVRVQTKHQLLQLHNHTTKHLGSRPEHISEDHPEQLREAIERYVESTDSGLSLWPIIKKVTIYGPWEILRSGAVLVDSPGVQDDNRARAAVVEGMHQF